MKTTRSNYIWRIEGPQILAVVIALVLPAAAGARKVKEVEVTNLPAVQSVEVVNAPTPAPPLGFQLVGFTSATFDGSQGVLGFTLACQAEFPGSRMCTSVMPGEPRR